MMRYLICAAGALICMGAHAQNGAARLAFEVASVKPVSNRETTPAFALLREISRSSGMPGTIPMVDPGRIRLENWALLDLIAAAYKVRASQVSGPGWLADQSFDVQARLPEGSTKAELNGMLQLLLEERFGLQVHRASQARQGFALTVGKNGPRLKPAEAPATPEQLQQLAEVRAAANQKLMQENLEAGTPLVGLARSSWRSITAEGLASQLARLLDAPVVNETGLAGEYSVSIQTWKNTDVPGGTVFDAVEKFGLKLEPRKIMVETVVVDQVSKAPKEN